jgi:cullin 1
MYSLLARIQDGLNPLRSRFELHVKKAGLSAIEKIAEQEGETVVCTGIGECKNLSCARL